MIFFRLDFGERFIFAAKRVKTMRKFGGICLVVLAGIIFTLGYTSEARICPPKSDKGVLEGAGNAGGTAGSNVDRNANTNKPVIKPLSPQQAVEDQARARQKAEADEKAARKAEEEKEARQRAIDDAVAQALSRQRKPETEDEKKIDKPEIQEPPPPPEPTEPKEPPEPSEPSEPKGPDSGTSGPPADKDIAGRFRGREDRRSREVGNRTQDDLGRTFAGGYGDGRKTSGELTAKVDSDLERMEKEQREKEERRRRGHGPTTGKPPSGGAKTTETTPAPSTPPAGPSTPTPSEPSRQPTTISSRDSSGKFTIAFQFPKGEGKTIQSTKIKDGAYTYDVVQIIMDEKVSYYEASVNISISGTGMKGWRMYIRSNLWDRGPQARTRIENPQKFVLKGGYYYQVEIDYNETLKVTKKDGTKEDQIAERTSLIIFQLKKITK